MRRTLPSQRRGRRRYAAIGNSGWRVNEFRGLLPCDFCEKDNPTNLIEWQGTLRTDELTKLWLCPLHIAIWDANPNMRLSILDEKCPDSTCAECGKRFYGQVDYLCRRCR